MANILFIAYDYPPILSPESIQVQRRAVTLANNGDRVIVLTSHTNPAFEFIDESLVEKHEKIGVIRTKKPYFEKPLNLFYKFYDLTDRKLWWKTKAFDEAIKILQNEKIDIIYTHSTPLVDHIVGLYLKRKFFNIKWIAHFSDPWTLNPYKNYKFKWQYTLNRNMEQRILDTCDVLSVTSEQTKELFFKNFHFLKNKIFVLPHTFNKALYVNNINSRENYSKIKIVHTGNIYGLRTIKYLLLALKEMKLSDVEFYFYGKIKKEEIDLVNDYKLDNIVKIFNPVSYLESLKIISKADFLLVIDAPLENSPFFPSKLADYIGAKKPIIALTPGNSATKSILDNINNNLFIASPENVNEIKNILDKIISFKLDDCNLNLKNIDFYDMENISLLKEVFNV